jgi:hypothetical protein
LLFKAFKLKQNQFPVKVFSIGPFCMIEENSTTISFTSKQSKTEYNGFFETFYNIIFSFFGNFRRQEYSVGIFLHIVLLLSYSFFLSILIQESYQLGHEVQVITFVLGTFLYLTSFGSLVAHFYSINTSMNNNREYLKIMFVVNVIFFLICLFVQFFIGILWLRNGHKNFFQETLISLFVVEVGHVVFALILRSILRNKNLMSSVQLKPKTASENLFDSFVIPPKENEKKE